MGLLPGAPNNNLHRPQLAPYLECICGSWNHSPQLLVQHPKTSKMTLGKRTRAYCHRVGAEPHRGGPVQ